MRPAVPPKPSQPASPDRCPYLAAVRTHADNLLGSARDVYGPQHTPLFVDEIELPAAQPRPKPWRSNQRTGQPVILSNLAQQQAFLRVLDGLSALTGQAAYRDAATEAIRYAFAHLSDSTGLLRWGGHCAYDALGDEWVGYLPGTHELKAVYPHYGLMHQADAAATQRFIEAFWNAHVYDWSVLDFNRHGAYDKPPGTLWEHPYVGRAVWFTSRGLTFLNTGSDLYYAAAMLSHLTGDQRSLAWAKRLNHRYLETRDPVTGMGGYQFSIRYLPGADQWCDRAIHQFSGMLCGHVVREGTVSTPRLITTICARAGAVRLALGEMLGADGAEFARSAVEDLAAYGRWAYRGPENIFHAIHTDGTVLTGKVFEKDGYYGPAGWGFRSGPGDGQHLLAYAMGYRLSGDAFLWQVARDLARGIGLGDIGPVGEAPQMDATTACAESNAVLGLLQLHQATANQAYLDLARRVADNILAQRFKDGFFTAGADSPLVRLDTEDPLALLRLSATLAGKADCLPALVPGPMSAAWAGPGGPLLARAEWDASPRQAD
ncbi:MAG: pectate lyase [Phycisphaerae bacterium]|nr:pectate lyase [Phycisphaerae bacterium]